MFKHVFLSACVLCLVGMGRPASAVEWDHEANLAGAVKAFLEAYDGGGLPQAEKIAADCQRDLDAIRDDMQRLMRLEYCSGLEFAGYLTSRRDTEEKGAAGSEYFTSEQIRGRLDRLGEFIPNPTAHTQVVRGWGRSVAEELDRRLK